MKVDPTLKDKKGQNLLCRAALGGKFENFCYLVEKCHLNPLEVDHRGMTAVRIAFTYSANMRLRLYLVKAGLVEGMTPSSGDNHLLDSEEDEEEYEEEVDEEDN